MARAGTKDTPTRSTPTILDVDDDPVVSRAGTRDLRSPYRAEFRVGSATSGANTLEIMHLVYRLPGDDLMGPQ
jgi:hypothetical protein